MLPTARWKLRNTLRQEYAERISYLEGNLQIQRKMAGEFLDNRDLEAVSSMHLTIIQDEQEIENLTTKLELLNDDSCFESLFKEREHDD